MSNIQKKWEKNEVTTKKTREQKQRSNLQQNQIRFSNNVIDAPKSTKESFDILLPSVVAQPPNVYTAHITCWNRKK